jgi:isopentenyl phosphate kinase
MLVLLKLGGSLITDKTRPFTPRQEVLEALASEIAAALRDDPDLQLILGHGSGSFGHEAARRFDTRSGVSGPEAWRGFAEVWYQAAALDRLVIDALRAAGLPALAISPASGVTAHDGRVFIWDLYPLQSALGSGLLPVVYGDVAFDEVRGGTILSTEELFVHLAHELAPQRILLAGQEAGVWADFPGRTHLVSEITPSSWTRQAAVLGAAAGADVTGGMRSKVAQMLALVEELAELEVLIFSGQDPANLRQAIRGGRPGTRLHR